MKYIIKPEMMGGDLYYMIYRKGLFCESFYERWNTPESAEARLKEIQA